jgi:Zn-finger nucleic acid-binding protein
MTVEQPQGHDSAVIRCSSCGAAREEGEADCHYCSAEFSLHERDLQTVCPECLTRVSDKAAYCHSCGEQLMSDAIAGDTTRWNCPSCGPEHALTSRQFGRERVNAAECQRCAGIWLTESSFQILRQRASEKSDLLPMATPRPNKRSDVERFAGYRPCPRCDNLMTRRNYGRGSGVIIDVCRHHGIWFDDKELSQILQWVAKGGAEKPRPHQDPRERLPYRGEAPAASGDGFFDDDGSELGLVLLSLFF